MKVTGVQKYKIDDIEENNEVGVLQLHKYVIQVGSRRQQKFNIYPFEEAV